jgi:hypothetical protein
MQIKKGHDMQAQNLTTFHIELNDIDWRFARDFDWEFLSAFTLAAADFCLSEKVSTANLSVRFAWPDSDSAPLFAECSCQFDDDEAVGLHMLRRRGRWFGPSIYIEDVLEEAGLGPDDVA